MKRKVGCSVLLLVLFMTSVVLVDSLFYQSNTILEESQIQEAQVSDEIQKCLITTQFYENLGQVKNNEITYFGSMPGGRIGFGVSKVFIQSEGENLILSFQDSQSVSPKANGASSHKANFFLGDRGTYTNVNVYTSIVFENLWSGIDLEYKGTEMGAKYEFLVQPGADPTQIKVRCEGHDNLMIQDKFLNINLKEKSLLDTGLIAFQGTNKINADFISLGSHSYGFQMDEYDKSQALLIDPVIYFTTINRSLDELGFAMALDSDGSLYGTGWTESWDFSSGVVYDDVLDGPTDCFVFKLSPDGNSIIYSTFIGGNESGEGDGIGVDASGNVYVAGWTNSADFPTTENAYNGTYNGLGSIFVCKLSPNGDDLIYSTYVGGSDAEGPLDLFLDTHGNTFVTGWTYSLDFPTVNPYASNHSGGSNNGDDVFVFKLNPDGDTLLLSTYVGGSGDDIAQGIEVDSSGDIYVTGWTDSDDFPTTENVFEEEHTEWVDMFVFKLSSTGDSLVYSTYIGATRYEFPRDIAIDEYGAVYLVGFTFSPDFPKVNAYDSSSNGDADCFMLKLSTTGESLLYSTYIGGNDTEQLFAVAVDQYGCAYACGFTDSPNFPMENAYNDTYPGGDTSGIILKMDADGNELLYSTYIGGNDDDFLGGICIDSDGNAYAGGVSFGLINDTFNADNSSAVIVVKLSDWSDGDRDNMPHAWEIEHGLNPQVFDGDGDLDSDGLANSVEFSLGTDPTNADSDGDGFSDGLEVEGGYDPLNAEIGVPQLLTYNVVYIVVGIGVVILIALYIKKDTLSEMYWNR